MRMSLRPMSGLFGLLLVLAIGDAGRSQAAVADEADSLAAWNRIVAVLQHPRCLNCHQLETPLQGDARRVHIPPVRRGADDMGAGTMRCYNCHNDTGNNEMAGVPGAPHWRLAPVSMLWRGLSSVGLCRMLQDRALNGGRDSKAIVEHMDTEKLIRWGWDPGARRQPFGFAPGFRRSGKSLGFRWRRLSAMTRGTMISLTINGRPHQLDVDPTTPLLWALRDDLGLTGTKFGCGRALCGACTVHIDGDAAAILVPS